jgi:hypothetical protein
LCINSNCSDIYTETSKCMVQRKPN